jgi:hypothetical protein
MSKADVDNRSNQLNHNNDAYYQSRGYDSRDDYYDDDDCGGGGRWNDPPCPPRELTATEAFLNSHSIEVRRQHEEKLRKFPSYALSYYLTHKFPIEGYLFCDRGHGDAVVVEVCGCDSKSADHDAIVSATREWGENYPGNLSKFMLTFVHENAED